MFRTLHLSASAHHGTKYVVCVVIGSFHLPVDFGNRRVDVLWGLQSVNQTRGHIIPFLQVKVHVVGEYRAGYWVAVQFGTEPLSSKCAVALVVLNE